jgi:hypothetical protein
MLVRDAEGKVTPIAVDSAPSHNYILGVDFQNDDIWVATAHGLSHGIRQHRAASAATAVPRVQDKRNPTIAQRSTEDKESAKNHQ